MTCSHCGAAVADGATFCPLCGTAAGSARAVATATSAALPATPAAPPAEDPLLLSLRLELAADYAVEKELGRGGMAIVFKAVELQLHRVVALKVLPPDMALQGDTAERFKREARLAAQLDHPHIIPVYRVGQAGNLHYMAMKFVEGRALDAIIENQGALPIPVALRALHATASALAFAHRHSIIHRDVKGGNVLIDKDGRVLVSDFGIARALTENSLTQSGMVVGTPNYMSPEQCAGTGVGPQSDQYSFGIMAFQMLTGALPFEAETIMGVIQHHYLTPVPDIAAVRPDVPEELLQIVYRALEKKPEARFANTADIVTALEAVPQTEEERREGLALLEQLSHGAKVREVRTGSLPPLKLTAGGMPQIPQGQAASASVRKKGTIRAKPPARRGGLIAAVVAVLVLGGGGAAYWALAIPAGQRAGAGGTPAATSENAEGTVTGAPGAPGPGAVSFAGLPAGAQVDVAGRILTDGRGTMEPGTYTYNVTAPGYRPTSGTVTVTAGITTPVTPVLVAAQAAPPQAAPAPVRREPLLNAKLRVRADQLQSEIFLDGQKVGTGMAVDVPITAGVHRLRISLSGFKVADTTFSVAEGETANLGLVRLPPAGGTP